MELVVWLDTESAFLEFDSDMVQQWAAVAVVVMALAVLELLILRKIQSNTLQLILSARKKTVS